MDLSGRIVATLRARGRVVPTPQLAGRITASGRARGGGILGPVLAGRVTARATAQLRFASLPVQLSGRIAAITVARATSGFAVIGRPLELSARLTATSSASATEDYPVARLSGRTSGGLRLGVAVARFVALSGQTATGLRARFANLAPFQLLSARLSARVQARWRWDIVTLTARLKSNVRSSQAGFPFRFLTGRIKTTVRGRATPYLRQYVYLGGQIKTVTSVQFGGRFMTRIGGRVKATVAARSGQMAMPTYLTGGRFMGFAGPSMSTRMFGAFTPTFSLRTSRIIISVRMAFGLAELQPPRPPYPPPFPTYQTDHYLDRITSEHNQRPRYVATVGLSVEPFVSSQELAAMLPGLFDLDSSQGEQEDFVGEWVGKSRWIELPTGFFSWDTPGLGWDQASWKGPFDATNYLERLDDFHYRLLLYAAIVANHWNGSVPQAYEAWDTLFAYTGLKVIIQDYGNMTMLYGLLWQQHPSTVLLSLFTTGQMDLKPEGVELLSYVFPPAPGVPLFAWDAESDSVAGWDEGSWGILVPPGTGYVPI